MDVLLVSPGLSVFNGVSSMASTKGNSMIAGSVSTGCGCSGADVAGRHNGGAATSWA